MCGRFTISADIDFVAGLFGAAAVTESVTPSYNVAPGRKVPVVIREGEGLVLKSFRWGLVPFWAKDPAIGNRLINARAETAAEKPSFRAAFARRRCLIPADGFYEWKREGKEKRPYHITCPGRTVFAFAGLWERWTGPEGAELLTCAILTVAPNAFMRPIHHRMPAILPREMEAPWLDPSSDRAALEAMLKPYEGSMRAVEVSTRVNSPANDDAGCLLPRG